MSGDLRSWRPTAALFRSASISFGLMVGAVVLRRPDLLVIATPLVAVTAWSLWTRPVDAPMVEHRLGRSVLREGEATSWRSVLHGDGLDVVTAETSDLAWFDRSPNRGAVVEVGSAGSAATTLALRSTRWGRHEISGAWVTASSAWGAFRFEDELPSRFMISLPSPVSFDASSSARPVDGLIGGHRAVRRGHGNEFSGIRPFQTGDRLRQINWQRSVRAESLHVNATDADRDTHVALVLDIAEDLGRSTGIDGASSSLDVTVRAAAAIAEHYLEQGDRVSLQNLDRASRLLVPPGSGRSHLRRILFTLAQANAPMGRVVGSQAYRELGADLIVVISAMTTDEALDRAVGLGRSGTAVVVIDTLPDDLGDDEDDLLQLAWRIRRLERRRAIRRAAEVGVAVVPWAGPGTLDQVLRDVGRRASAPRLRRTS